MCERKWVRFVSIFIDPFYFVLANKKEDERPETESVKCDYYAHSHVCVVRLYSL